MTGRSQSLDKIFSDGQAFLARGQLSSARNRFSEFVKRAPADPRGHFFLGAIFLAEGAASNAVKHLETAHRIAPENVDIWTNLGLALAGTGDPARARAYLEQALAARPDDPRMKLNLANTLIDLKEPARALSTLEDAGSSCDILVARGQALLALERPAEALELARAAAKLAPDDQSILHDQRVALQSLGRFEEAISVAERQLALGDPTGMVRFSISELYTAKGLIDRAIALLERAIEDLGGESDAPFELVRLRAMRRLYLDGGNSPTTAEYHRAAGRRLETLKTKANPRSVADAERRLKIGFVSPDLRAHSVMNFLLGPLAAFDPMRLEVDLYSNAPEPDRVTERAKAFARSYREIRAMDAETAAKRIRDDGIDILIDLAGHTIGSRLDVFARQPAPVQMTWLGYPFSTGMRRVQYRLSDPVADPPDLARPGYTERFLYLNHFLCYAPLDPLDRPKPRSGEAPLVFGAFNNLDKYDPGTLRFWARIMDRIPGATLKIRQRHLRHAEARDAWRDRLVEHGFDPQRVDLGPFDDSRSNAQFAIHDEVDICLDPLIYNGTTTTCNALWMGVPVIVVAGEPHAARVGASIMAAAGLPEFVARDEADAIEKIVALAQDRARLAEYRGTLRNRLQTSPLCDADGFARDFEAKLRTVWREYCAKA